MCDKVIEDLREVIEVLQAYNSGLLTEHQTVVALRHFNMVCDIDCSRNNVYLIQTIDGLYRITL